MPGDVRRRQALLRARYCREQKPRCVLLEAAVVNRMAAAQLDAAAEAAAVIQKQAEEMLGAKQLAHPVELQAWTDEAVHRQEPRTALRAWQPVWRRAAQPESNLATVLAQ